MKAFTASLIVATMMAGSVWSAQAQETTFVAVTHGQASDPFWSVVKNAVAQAASDMGVTVDYRAPETFDMVAMAQLIDAAVNQNPAGLIVSIPDGDALGPSIQKAVAAGIPVISMNAGPEAGKRLGALLHVGQDEYTAGKAAGEKLKEMGGKKGICVNHEVGNVALDLRCQGYTDGFGAVTVLPTSNDPADVKAKVKAAITSDPEIDTIVTLTASLAGEPTVEAVAEAGAEGKVNIGSFDLSAGLLQAVADGKAAFAIDQQQYLQGYMPVVILALYDKYGLVPSADLPSGPNLITQDKAAQVVDLSAKGIR